MHNPHAHFVGMLAVDLLAEDVRLAAAGLLRVGTAGDVVLCSPGADADVTIPAKEGEIIPVSPGYIVRKTGTTAGQLVAFEGGPMSTRDFVLMQNNIRAAAPQGINVGEEFIISGDSFDPAAWSYGGAWLDIHGGAVGSPGGGSVSQYPLRLPVTTGTYHLTLVFHEASQESGPALYFDFCGLDGFYIVQSEGASTLEVDIVLSADAEYSYVAVTAMQDGSGGRTELDAISVVKTA
jgi:hypothetical protein